MGATRSGAGKLPQLQGPFLRPEHRLRTLGPEADDWYPSQAIVAELDRTADEVMLADAEDHGLSRTAYMAEHGLAIRVGTILIDPDVAPRFRPVDLMREWAPTSGKPGAWGHHLLCVACGGARGGLSSMARRHDPGKGERAHTPEEVTAFRRHLEDEAEDRVPAPNQAEDPLPTIDVFALAALELLVPDFDLVVAKAAGMSFRAIGEAIGKTHPVAAKRVRRAARIARDLLAEEAA